MTQVAAWLAVLYVALLLVGRSGLPLSAQWGDLLFPLLVVAVVRGGEIGRWWRREDWPLAVYLGVTLLTSMVSVDPLTGFKHFAKQVYVALIFVVFRHLARDASLSGRLQRTFVLAFALVTVVSLVEVFLLIPGRVSLSMFGATDALPFLGVVRRLRGGLAAPEMLGNGLLVAFVLALALRLVGPGRAQLWWTAIATLLAAAEFLTFSHSVAGFAVATVLFAAASTSSRPLRSLGWIGAASVVVIVNAASLVDAGPVVTDYGVGPVSIEFMGARVEGRLMHYAALKQVAWSGFREHPLTGIGPGRFMVETERAFKDGRLTARYREKPPQCDAAGRLAETGIAGGISLFLLWASWLRAAGRIPSTRSGFQRAGFAAVVGILVNSLNADVMNFRFLWLALAWASVPGHESTGSST